MHKVYFKLNSSILYTPLIHTRLKDGAFEHKSAGLIRTCRKLADGQVYVPAEIWDGHTDR